MRNPKVLSSNPHISCLNPKVLAVYPRVLGFYPRVYNPRQNQTLTTIFEHKKRSQETQLRSLNDLIQIHMVTMPCDESV